MRRLKSPPFAFAVLLAALPALAQTPSAPPDVRAELPPSARTAWDAAKQLAAANDYKAAQVEFQRSYDESHNPRVLYNLGVVEKLLTHYSRAVTAWERELAEGGSKLTPGEVGELKNAIGIVRRFVTTIEVTASEPDATLSIDDYEVGKTPFIEPVRIDVGRRTLKLSKPGFADATQILEVAAGQATPVSFTLEPVNKTAYVQVNVGGAHNATVFIDGKDMGPAPFKGDVSAERHTIEARAPGFVTVSQTIDVIYHQPTTLVLALSQERHEGRLRISAPEGSEIAVDRQRVGTGTWEGIVSSTGSHQVVVTQPGFQTYSTDTIVGDDQTRDLDIPLNRQVSTSWVAWGVGSLLVATAGIVVGYYVFKPTSPTPFVGDLNPGVTTASRGFRF